MGLPSANRWGRQYSYDTLPPEKVRLAAQVLPWVRQQLIKFSRDEYDRNPYYQSVIKKLASHTIGPYPSIIGLSNRPEWDDEVEDVYLDWVRDNSIARAYRRMRREAALTGIGFLIPYIDKDSENPVKRSYKCYGADCLKTPYDARPTDRIYSGIEYDKNWEPVKFHIVDIDHTMGKLPLGMKDTKEYTINELLFYSEGYENGLLTALPECYGAFTMYPFVRRYIQAALESAEFRASMPMTVELDPEVYLPDAAMRQPGAFPRGTFEYESREIKTLMPGMKLQGIPQGASANDTEKLIKAFAAIAALCVEMPANVALGDSSDSNMASAQVDVQPWANKVNIDRFDMEPVFRRSFRAWYSEALLTEGVFTRRAAMASKYRYTFPHANVYTDIHSHPDPTKRANARMIDLVSGATTLNRIYSAMGLNARRELKRDADLLGITIEEMVKVIISGRSKAALEALMGEEEKDDDTSRKRKSTTVQD